MEQDKEPEVSAEQIPEAQPQSPSISVPTRSGELESLDLESDTDEERPSPASFIPKKSKKSKKWLLIPLILLIIGSLGFGVWKLLTSKKTTVIPTKASQPAASTLKTYKISSINVGFSYPSDWKVTEETNKATVTSPTISYKKKDGTTTNSVFRLIIQQGVNQSDADAINNTVAIKTSDLIQYDAPVTGQRTQTYLSYVGKDSTTFNFFIISSDHQYNPGDKVAGTLPLSPGSDIITGGYGTTADNGIAFDNIAISSIKQNQVFSQATAIVKSLKLY